ncbi:MAG TPA: AbrB family transcriptional regulator [Peptococcaceae bacterium]|nr:AbrB family transcriptional regulator [Peptococcaceae bacterium]
MPYIATVSQKGWIVIPKELRTKLKIRPGSKVLLTEGEEGLVITPLPEDPIAAFRGMLKGFPLVEELLEVRKEEAAREELRAGQLRGAGVLPG